MEIVRGKGAMVWRLREWRQAIPEAQVEHALALGLSWVSIKIIDGTDERWERQDLFPDNQNDDLLPEAVEALREAGIVVIGWGYEYGRDPERSWGAPSEDQGLREAEKTVELCNRYRIKHFQIDAEGPFRGSAMFPVARAFAQRLNRDGPEIEYSLCSYRYPVTHQPDFPVMEFAPLMDAWCPQVYFIEDNRLDAAAIQTELSLRQYNNQVRPLPYYPIWPTYRYSNGWRATGEQLRRGFVKAVELGLPAAGVWDLPQANAEQLDAIAEFDWPEPDQPPPPPSNLPEQLRGIALGLAGDTNEHLSETGNAVQSYANQLLSLADEIDGG